jgi:hypothetical protein
VFEGPPKAPTVVVAELRSTADRNSAIVMDRSWRASSPVLRCIAILTVAYFAIAALLFVQSLA